MFRDSKNTETQSRADADFNWRAQRSPMHNAELPRNSRLATSVDYQRPQLTNNLTTKGGARQLETESSTFYSQSRIRSTLQQPQIHFDSRHDSSCYRSSEVKGLENEEREDIPVRDDSSQGRLRLFVSPQVRYKGTFNLYLQGYQWDVRRDHACAIAVTTRRVDESDNIVGVSLVDSNGRALVHGEAYVSHKDELAFLVQQWLRRYPILVGHGLQQCMTKLDIEYDNALERDVSEYFPFQLVEFGHCISRPIEQIAKAVFDIDMQDSQLESTLELARMSMQLYIRVQEHWEAEIKGRVTNVLQRVGPWW